ncbi:hypothetical protein ST47_g6726 [Ascochyta rabiei]|uniref:Nuclear pore complex protein Nup85 n=1 Tax=Didymella rabiei TaxID=5454 RepID=A0A163C0Y9_DIDRA|nr:hypothetical protein ST47_g6726 [Ascochyta rabiei]
MFRVPSSTPPSTPGRSSRFNGPTTTPAGPPPDESYRAYDVDKPYYGTTTFGRPGSGQRSRPTSRPASGAFGNSFHLPSSPPHQPLHRDDEREHHDDDHMDGEEGEEEEEEEEDDDDDMDDDDDNNDYYEQDQLAAQRRPKTNSRLSHSVVSRTSTTDLEPGPTLVRPGAKQTQFDLVALAKGLAPNADRADRAALQEPDSVILDTERVLQRVHDSLHSDTPDTRAGVLGEAARDLVALWHSAANTSSNSSLSSSRSGGSVGLQRTSALSLVPRPDSQQYTPVPKLLLHWLNHTYSAVSEVELVLKETRGYSRHHSFWEAVQASAVRGNFGHTLQLLQGASLDVAESAQNDGLGDHGYTGSHLRYANEAVRSAISLLRECPAVASDDWDVKGQDWSIFRSRVHHVYNDLQELAEGDSASFQLSVSSRKAESRVPWSVYEELRRLYQLLLGNEEEILAISADWIEAVLGLTIWWDGEEDDLAHGSFAASRRSLMRSQRLRSVDVTPLTAYCQRLSSSFAAVVQNSDEEFSVNVTDRFEVGLACVLDDNIEGVLHILRACSLTAASAVAEVASAGGWYKPTRGLVGGFDRSDLMVLSYNEQTRTGATKDDLQIAYASALSTKRTITSHDGRTSKEGWELAVQVLSRLDDSFTASQRMESIINDLPLDSADQVDKITQLCHNMNLQSQAVSIALKFADHLRANTQNYGDTLLYYARAHNTSKIQEVLRVLVAHCLIKSIAYPPLVDLDTSLNSLITSPKQTLTKLATQDAEAASILSSQLSGYATIRKFYDLRDEEVLLKQGDKPSHRPMARKRAAANALMVIISSAASSIQGGLYDAEMETVVQVDVLLPLLGEALVFISQPKRTLTLRHLCDLLAVIEDFETTGALLHNQCEEVLRTTLAAAHGDPKLPTPHALLQKSASALSASSYSLIGSQDFSQDGQSTDSSTVLVKSGKPDDPPRGWDWRRAFPKGATGGQILSVLRLGISREVARCFAEGEVVA